MISVFLPAYPFRGIRANYLWFFYRIVTTFREPVYFIMGEDYLKPVEQWSQEDRWEILPDSQKRLGFKLPDFDEFRKNHKFSILDESFLNDYLDECFNNPDEIFKKFITEVLPELECEIYSSLNKVNNLECVLSWCNCPSLNSAAERKNIKVINMEMGPLRAPDYLKTAYFDFKGVNGNTEAEARYFQSNYKFNPHLELKQLRDFFSFKTDGKLNKPLHAEEISSFEHNAADIPLPEDQVFDTGIVLQVENDSNILAFNNTFSNQALIDYSEMFLPGSKIIRVHPGSRFFLKEGYHTVDTSSSSIDFIRNCKSILTINSSVGLEALLQNVPVKVMGDSSYSFCCVDDTKERIHRLAFYLFSYLVPFELLFDIRYLRFRLSFPDESEIIKKHVRYYLSNCNSECFDNIEKQAIAITGYGAIEKTTSMLINEINQLTVALTSEKNETARLNEELAKLEMVLSEQTGEYIVDVIVPVYAGLQETSECIESVLRSLPGWAQLVVINDSSPEPELTQWLRKRAITGKFRLIENEQNLGFVATVNRGMRLNPQRDVLLLNSDVEVANDWLARIRDAAYSLQRIGSITPFSNNATICSFPNFCQDNELYLGLNVSQLDDHFSTYGTKDNLVEVPTGVGFCMYIRRDCLNEVGYFDVETFGRGYGEENDWCQRAAKAGWPNFHQLNVFVYHKGGVSFAGEQSPRKKKALELLNELHPNYTKDVMDFISKDPAEKARQQIILRIIAAQPFKKVLLISHKMGGGVTQHLEQLRNFYDGQVHYLLLTPVEDGKSVALSLSLGENNLSKFIIEIEHGYTLLVRLLQFIGVGHIHFHHMIGMPERIFELSNALSCSYDVTVHDYYFVNANPTLTDKYGIFVGDDIAVRDKVCAEHYSVPNNISAEEWRSKISPWLENASRIIFPSADTCHRFLLDYPQCDHKSIIAWHPDYEINSPYPECRLNFHHGQRLKVMVLGALSREKGALLLEEVASGLKNDNIEFHLLGYAFRELGGAVKTHGSYSELELAKRIDEIQPHILWFPAQWPETYSYTLSIALEHAIPVVVPDIGAFRERVNGRAYSRVIKWNTPADKLCDLWRSLLNEPDSFFSVPEDYPTTSPSNKARCMHFYRDNYIQTGWLRENQPGCIDYHALVTEIHEHFRMTTDTTNPRQGRKEKLLKILWHVSRFPGVSWCVKFIPYRVQRYIKRCLSRKAIHEIIR